MWLHLAFVASLGAARAQETLPARGWDRARLIGEAAARFKIPTGWIDAVMGVESAYDPRAVSRAGALGLMQVMPATYAELRARYGLGDDPLQPRDNVLAGSAYLRELYDRFGAPGFLAAYNAGPDRYRQHLVTGRPLPLETRRYLALLAPRIMASDVTFTPVEVAPPSSVFVRLDAEPTRPGAANSALFVALSWRGEAP